MRREAMWQGAELELLDRADEVALFGRYHAGERGLEDRLVRSQLRLVVFLAHRYKVAAQDLEDLVQQGAMGVVEVEETAARMDGREVNLDTAADGKGASLRSRLASPEPSAESTAEQAELVGLVREEVRLLRATLGARDRTLLDAHFCDETKSLAELGKQFGVSRERARQLEARLLGQLRTRVEERLSA